MLCKRLVVPTTVWSKKENHRKEDVQITGSMENMSMTLGSKPEPSLLSASLPQQSVRDEILPPDRPISFIFLIIRHISALIDVYHRQMTFGLVCHYPMFASGKLSYFFPQKSYWGVVVLQWEGQIRFMSHLCYIHQLDLTISGYYFTKVNLKTLHCRGSTFFLVLTQFSQTIHPWVH